MPFSSRPADVDDKSSENSSNILFGALRPDLIRQETLADLFEATADKSPEQAALIFADRVVRYAELNTCADIVASRLIESGVLPGHILGLWLPRGIDLLIMQVAIAKTGAAWLPFDADTPVDRIAVCLDDADAFGLLSCDLLGDDLNNIECQIWTAEQMLAPSALPLQRHKNCLPSDPAYVIYTSGSTEKPNGIAINQGSICHFLNGW